MARSSNFFRRLRDDSAGNTLAIAAAAMLPLTALAGGALDMSVAYMARAKLQNACDAAALAGRQSMEGVQWTDDNEAEARKFFDFNFPEGTHSAQGLDFEIAPNPDDNTEILGSASASVPTTLMRIFGKEGIGIAVTCNAKRDLGHNDVVLVLDVTGSMAQAPSNGSGTKIERLREGALGLFRALDDSSSSVTRYGIVPYSHTVNVARSLSNKDILRNQEYVDVVYQVQVCSRRRCEWVDQPEDYVPSWRDTYRTVLSTKIVHINRSTWNLGQGGTDNGNIQGFRTSGDGCIEERPSVGNAASPIRYNAVITRADVDREASNAGNQQEYQFGRYDPGVQEGMSQVGCPSEATKLRSFDDIDAYEAAINAATVRVTGGTYHDVGMLWGLRFISRTGYFSSENPTHRDGIPVNQHIVFMTDGMLDTGGRLYSAHGIEDYQGRTQGTGTRNERHLARFASACSLAKSMGVTVWVIALDVTDTSAVEPCATSPGHFYTSDGSDLDSVFSRIGQGIGRLRLTQ